MARMSKKKKVTNAYIHPETRGGGHERGGTGHLISNPVIHRVGDVFDQKNLLSC